MKTSTCKATRNTALASLMTAMLIAGTVQAATITVNTLTDEFADGGNCSLREAVHAVNTGADANGCVADISNPYGTSDTIMLGTGTYTLSIAPEDPTPVADGNNWQVGEYTATWSGSAYQVTVTPDASQGDLDITKSVNIIGEGKDVTIIDGGWRAVPWNVMSGTFDPKTDPVVTNAGFEDRVLHVVARPEAGTVSVSVEITGLTLKGGNISTVAGLMAPDALTEYSLRRDGGGLATAIAAGAFVPATSGGGPGGGGSGPPPDVGPGGEETGASYALTLTNVAMVSNYAGDGGGLYNAADTVAIGIVISGNRSNANGGGIYNDAPMAIFNSTFSGNSAEGGGALFDTGSHITNIAGSTFSGNGAVGGGGVSGRAGVTINMLNSTVSGNFAFDVGGGIYTNGQVNLIHVTVAKNIVSQSEDDGHAVALVAAPPTTKGSGINTFPSNNDLVTLRGTLIADNVLGNPADPATWVSANCGATGGTASINSTDPGLGYNLSSDNSCLLAGPGDMQNVDAKILALADNGGATKTHALDATSPAINAAVAVVGVTIDQRGVAHEGAPDIGAYEYVASSSSDDGGGDGTSGCLLTMSRGGRGPVDPMLPAIVITAAMFLALSRVGLWRRRPVLVR